MISSHSAPSYFWVQGFRDGGSFGLTRQSDGLVINAHDYDLEIDLEAIGNFKVDGSEGMELYIPLEDPPYIHLRATSRQFDTNWAPVALVVSSKDTSTAVRLCPVAPDEDNRIVFGQASQYETSRAEREMKVNVPGRDGLFTAYHDITYMIQFIRRTGTTFSKSRSCGIDDLKARIDIVFTGPDICPTPESPSPPPFLTHGNDVALVFPFETVGSPAILWSGKKDLMDLSAYFEAMFTGGYSETDNVLSETSRLIGGSNIELAHILELERLKCQSDPPAQSTSPASDDSDIDDAEEDVIKEEEPDDKDRDMIVDCEKQASTSSSSPNIHYVVIKHARYKTYKALLHWAKTNDIQFSCLRSSADYSPSPYASPKSVYKLAHQLGIAELEEIAAKNFESQLGPSIILKELFSATCFAYPALREAACNALGQQ